MLSVNQYISKVIDSQQYRTNNTSNQSKTNITLRDPIPSQEVISDRKEFFDSRKLTPSTKRVLNYLFMKSNSFKQLYFRQDTIARDLKCSRKTVNEAIGVLVDYGIIAVFYRSTRKKFTSCMYTISSWFRNLEVRESLRHIFNAFVCFPVALLISSFQPVIAENVTRYSKSIFISNQSRICKSRDASARARENEYHPWLERFAVPTRVEEMKSWNPVDDIYPPNDPFRPAISQKDLFKDPRVIHPKDEETQAYQKKSGATRGSKQSGQSLRSSMATQAYLQRQAIREEQVRASWQIDPDKINMMWEDVRTNESINKIPGLAEALINLGKKCYAKYGATPQVHIADPLLELSKLTPEQVATRMLGKTKQQQEQLFQDVIRARRKYCQISS